MEYELSDEFRAKFKKQNVRLKKALLKILDVFYNNPQNPQLNNHLLKRNLKGINNIHIISHRTNDYCAIYKEMVENNGEIYAYFIAFGTHEELFAN